MTKKDVESKILHYFNSGFCCSESVFKTLMEYFGEPVNNEMVKLAGGFCGGIGGTHQEICGALTGAILALGLNDGRTEPSADIQELKALAARLIEVFKKKYQTTNCNQLLQLIDQQEAMTCHILSSQVGGMAVDLLSNK